MSKVIKCDSCKHNEVCKFKDEFEALNKKIQEMFYEKSEPSPFDVEAACKYFSKPESYWPEGAKRSKGLREPTNVPKDFDDFKWPNTIKINEGWADLDCETCPSNPKFNPLGIQVGDSPCTWCPKMQPKCISDSTLTTATCPKDIKTKLTSTTTTGE